MLHIPARLPHLRAQQGTLYLRFALRHPDYELQANALVRSAPWRLDFSGLARDETRSIGHHVWCEHVGMSATSEQCGGRPSVLQVTD